MRPYRFLVADDHPHDLTEREVGRELLRPLPECLAFLGSVDAIQTDRLRPAVVEQGDRVAVCHPDDLALENLGPGTGSPGGKDKKRDKGEMEEG